MPAECEGCGYDHEPEDHREAVEADGRSWNERHGFVPSDPS
jgi:hypothetical protein